MNQGIYEIVNPLGQRYIGASSRVSARLATHKQQAKRAKRAVNHKLAESYSTYGPASHRFAHIACPLPGVPLHELERDVIACVNPELNINRTPVPLPTATDLSGKCRRWGQYASLAEAAEALGLSRRQARYWANTGRTPDEVSIRRIAAKEQAEVRRGAYEQRREAAAAKRRAHDAHVQAQASRYDSEFGPVRPRMRDPHYLYIDGRWAWWRDHCHNGQIPVATTAVKEICSSRGISLLEAILFCRANMPAKRRVMLFGESYELKSLVKRYGLKYQTVMTRLNRLGWTIEQALGLQSPPSVQEAEKRAYVRAREAAEKRAAREVTVDGVTGTLNAVCRHLRLPYSKMRYRVQSGKWTPQEAADYLRRV